MTRMVGLVYMFVVCHQVLSIIIIDIIDATEELIRRVCERRM